MNTRPLCIYHGNCADGFGAAWVVRRAVPDVEFHAGGEPFAACYWDTPKGRQFSVRSRPEGIDVSAVAKMYGGGGHEHAAGFRVSFEQAAGFEVRM